MKKVKWGNFIHSDPSVLFGKPVVKGTRLAVEFILGLYAEGWTEDQILENYPNLTKESLLAVFWRRTVASSKGRICSKDE